MREQRPQLWFVIPLLVLLTALASWPAAAVPERQIPHDQAEPWMLEALPGIGPKTAAAMSAAVRRGDLAALPPAAQELALRCFAW